MLRFKRQEKQRGRSRRGEDCRRGHARLQFQRREVSGMGRPWADEVNKVLKTSAGFRKYKVTGDCTKNGFKRMVPTLFMIRYPI